ncbi:methyl-accepting chemotaxis protein [Thermosporothrix hazakensis]|jgi:methyl-accepting chemotaxis protein|uniref:Methyl-accepting chemotaxis protein n=2 Tax=Thermosporothrix TaxID=768650 RepID=A0A326U915_THEHA|nr:methyl-accepting chemotaxis protein [Thermosporothrix hazakensis]PZW23317.1 methyl-accepting chemotaxis protein [Thermosporothrix hazakensis]BBH89570.1 hypothetical protein KTC_43210 [Thermosporothrix sp. COM3]GCE47756.1 hypothetical protein KTH_26250 [Thermosporothrix hazakensis]
MLKFISNIPIFRRLFSAFLLAAVIPGIVIGVLGWFFTNTVNDRSEQLKLTAAMVQQSTHIDTALKDLSTQPRLEYPIWAQSQYQAQLPTIIQEVHQKQGQVDKDITKFTQEYEVNTSAKMGRIKATLSQDLPDPGILDQQQKLFKNVREKLWPDFMNAQNNLLKHLEASTITANPTADADKKALDDAFKALNDSWKQIDTIANQINTQTATTGPSITNALIFATIIALLVTMVFVIFIGYIVNLTITNPLLHLATLTKRIAKGETNARAQLQGRDEIYTVAQSMNNMLDNIVRLIQETQAQRDSLQGQVEKLVSEVSGVGEGDLRVQAEVTADALGVLADSFNYMVEELGSLVVRVKVVASEVEKTTSTILDSMTQLVETADVQIQQMGEAGVEVENMAASSRQVAERSQMLFDVANKAREDAHGGRNALQQAVEGMGRINENVQGTALKVQMLGERSREIDEIAEAMTTIAHQTNRLALDAAIQAAMAGENGKGFGAVAADIRRLAERAKDQATSIGRIVRGVREEIGAVALSMQETQRETAAGSRLTQEAGIALSSIFSAIEHQAREVENINKAAMQQLQSSSAIVRIMHEVAESTKQSSVNTREASGNMERLARLVEQLRASVEAFKLREDQEYYMANSGMGLTAEDSSENPLTFSGVFRTVSATAQPAEVQEGTFDSLPQGMPAFTPASFEENQISFPDNWDWNQSTPPLPSWSGEHQAAGNNNSQTPESFPGSSPRWPQSGF